MVVCAAEIFDTSKTYYNFQPFVTLTFNNNQYCTKISRKDGLIPKWNCKNAFRF